MVGSWPAAAVGHHSAGLEKRMRRAGKKWGVQGAAAKSKGARGMQVSGTVAHVARSTGDGWQSSNGGAITADGRGSGGVLQHGRLGFVRSRVQLQACFGGGKARATRTGVCRRGSGAGSQMGSPHSTSGARACNARYKRHRCQPFVQPSAMVPSTLQLLAEDV